MATVKTLSHVPSFASIWAAALSRPPVARSASLPHTVYAVRDVRIDPERSAQFDHVLGVSASDYVHPGFLHVLAFPVALSLMAAPRFPAPLLGLVHVKNSVLQHRPITVGERIDIDCHVQNLAPHRRGRTFEAVSVISSGGSIIATDVSTYLARGQGAADSSGESASQRSVRPPFTPRPPSARWRLPSNTGRTYASVSGDINPIHMSALSAKAFGFPSAIAHGMYTASRAFSEAGPDLAQPLRWDVEFAAPVLLPATVWVSYTDDGGGRTEFQGYKAARPRRGADSENAPAPAARLHFSGSVENLDARGVREAEQGTSIDDQGSGTGSSGGSR